MKKRKVHVVTILICSLTILLSGCNKGNDQAEKEHNELKTENITLSKANSKLEGKYEELEEAVEVLKQQLNDISSKITDEEVSNTDKEDEKIVSLPIYTKSLDSDEVKIHTENSVSSESTLEEKLSLLLGTLSELKFKALKIELKSLEGNHAVIKIRENEEDYNHSGAKLYFKNDDTYEETKASLIETLLQRNYKGEWIDSVRIIYEGPESWRNSNIKDIEDTFEK